MNIKESMHKNYEVNLQDDGWGGEGGTGRFEWRRAKLSSQRRLARDGKNLVLRPHLDVFVVLSARSEKCAGVAILGLERSCSAF